MRYIALLRGINVGGNTVVKMSDLKTLFMNLGFLNVETYINSGNVAFDTESQLEEGSIEGRIEKAIEIEFARPIPVMVRDPASIGRVIAGNPFEGQFESHKEMHVLFLKEELPIDKSDQLQAAATPPERFAVASREIYCHLPMGVADSLLGKSFMEKKLKVAVTGRNWRTVEKLAEL